MSKPATIPPSHSATSIMDLLRLRHRVARRVRDFFDARGFLEVCTPLLSSETFADRYLDPFRVVRFSDPQRPLDGPTWYLQTSPELHMKRLLADGATAIYQITQAFRGGESGPRHNPEFTILEWYRVGDDYLAGRRLLREFLLEIFAREGYPSVGIEEVSYAALFERQLGLDPHLAPLDELQRAAAGLGIMTDGMDRGAVVDALLAIGVEPSLSERELVLIHDFPVHQSALARIRPERGGIAERFEAYFHGLELANGYYELTALEEHLERHRVNNGIRRETGRETLPEPFQFTQSIRDGLPDTAGVALGFDRLLMALAGVPTIRKIQTFPAENA